MYKKGDIVKIRGDLATNTVYAGTTFVYDMRDTLGKVVTIKSVRSTYFTIKENLFVYSFDMIQPKTNKLFKLL